MIWQRQDYDDIPGTYVFDGRTANAAYALNKLLFSFNRQENRDAYAADPAAYADRFELTPGQRSALLREDFLELIRQGANIYYVIKLAVPKGVSVQDAGAAFQRISREEFQAKLDANADGLEQKLKNAGGFWNG